MHIIVNGWFWGDETSGSGQYLHYLIAHLPPLLLDVESKITLVVPQREDEGSSQTEPISLPAKVALHPIPLPRLPRQLAKLWWEQITLPRVARAGNAKLLWVPYWAAPLWQPIPTVVTIHDIIPHLLPAYQGGRPQKLYTRLVTSSAQRAEAIVTVSQASHRDVITHLNVDPAKVHAVLSGPNDSASDALSTSSAQVREKYALPERFFLYIGGFDVRKNVVTVVRGYQAYLQKGGDPDVKLVVAGKLPKQPSDFFPDITSAVQTAGLEESVHFCGFVDEVDKPMLYQLSVGYLFPSLYEGFGMTVIEAMNAGTPVLTSGSDGQ